MKAIKAGLFAAGLMFATASIATPITITDPNFYTDLTAGVSNTLDGFNLTGPVSGPATLHVRYGQWNGTFDDLSIVLTFGGYTEPEIADIQGITERTVQRDWRRARAFLIAQLGSA